MLVFAMVGCGVGSGGSSEHPITTKGETELPPSSPASNEPVSSGGTGESTDEGCYEQSRTPLDPDQQSSLGFSPNEWTDALGGARSAQLQWETLDTTGLSIGVSLVDADEVTFQDPAHCPDAIGATLEIAVQTDDGALDEDQVADAYLHNLDRVQVRFEVSPDALQGTYAFTHVDPADYHPVRLQIVGIVDATGTTGTLSEWTDLAAYSGPSSTWAQTPSETETFQVGTWSP